MPPDQREAGNVRARSERRRCRPGRGGCSAAAGSICAVRSPATSKAIVPRTSSWKLRVIPAATASASMPAPANAPMLQLPCSPDISIRRPVRSTAMAWVFIATSSVPWNAPQANSAANRAAGCR